MYGLLRLAVGIRCSTPPSISDLVAQPWLLAIATWSLPTLSVSHRRCGRELRRSEFVGGCSADSERFYFETHPALQAVELRPCMESFRALCRVVDYAITRGIDLAKVAGPPYSHAQGDGLGLRAWPRPIVRRFAGDAQDLRMAAKTGLVTADEGSVQLENGTGRFLRLHQEAYGKDALKPKHHWLLDIPSQLRRDGMILDAFVIERQHLW